MYINNGEPINNVWASALAFNHLVINYQCKINIFYIRFLPKDRRVITFWRLFDDYKLVILAHLSIMEQKKLLL